MELEERGYLNDQSFTEVYARHLIKEKKLGPRAVQYKFIPHKINEKIFSDILFKIYSEFDPSNLVQWHIEKFFNGRKRLINDKKKLYNLLQRKGFSYSDFSELINDLSWKERLM